MRKVTITVNLKGSTFVSEFTIDENVKEYMVADDAYVLAMRFAYTKMIATYGYALTGAAYADFLSDLDYNYSINSIGNAEMEISSDN